MTSTTKTVSKTLIIRDLADIDPKVAAAAAVAAIVIVVGAALAFGHIVTLETYGAAVGSSALPVLVAYAKASSHRRLIEDTVANVSEAAAVIAPAVDAVLPAAAPAVEVAVDGIDAIQAALAPTPPVTVGASAVAQPGV